MSRFPMSSLVGRFAGKFSRWAGLHEGAGLREQLQREAGAVRPQFSANLHRRLCQAVQHATLHATRESTVTPEPAITLEANGVRQHGAEREHYPVDPSNRTRVAWGGLNLWGGASLATSGLLVLVGWIVSVDSFWNSATISEVNIAGRTNSIERTDSVERMSDPTASLATLASLPDQAVVQIEQWIVSSMANKRWAYLEHDARLVSEWLVEDLPWKVPAVDSEPDISENNS